MLSLVIKMWRVMYAGYRDVYRAAQSALIVGTVQSALCLCAVRGRHWLVCAWLQVSARLRYFKQPDALPMLSLHVTELTWATLGLGADHTTFPRCYGGA